MNSQDKNENEPVSGGKELRFEPDDVGITILKEDVDAGDEENENLLDSKLFLLTLRLSLIIMDSK